MVKAKKWIHASQYDGEPKVSNYRLESEDVPAPKDGEFLCEAVYFTVDPYMRNAKFSEGDLVLGEQVARVTESRNKDYPVGCLVQMYCGWRSHTLVSPNSFQKFFLTKVPDVGKRAPSIVLGLLGMPGMTAYFGFLELCQPKAGETVLVNGAAGAVGSAVGQIAKIKGCKVIGFAGTDDKCDYVKSLGFDHVFNYRKTDIDEALKKAAPDGIDCYFDNVGGNFSSKVLEHMKLFGRISVCGSISTYSLKEQPKLPFPFWTFLDKQLRVEGFNIRRFYPRFKEGKVQMLKWANEGKIKYKETVRNGFDQVPQAFIDMLKGDNTGKMVVKI